MRQFTRLVSRFAFLCAILAYAAAVHAATRYVWEGSPGPGPGFTTWATAARTIQDAVDGSSDGDTILVTNGVYSTGGRAVGGGTLNRVALDRAVTVRSVNGAGATVIEGTTNLACAVRCAYVGPGAMLAGFTLTNGLAIDSDGAGGGVRCADGGSVAVCVLGGNVAQDGGGASGGTLINCLITGNYAVQKGGGAAWARLFNCTVVGNTSADEAAGGTYGCQLVNCIVVDNAAAGPARNYAACDFDHSCTAPGPEAGVGNIDAMPGFIDPDAGDYRLREGSPCVNSGADLDGLAGTTDLDGRPRLCGTHVEMGAYAYSPNRAGALASPAVVAVASNYTCKDLGTLAGYPQSKATAINANGDIVGYAYGGSGVFQSLAFIYTKGKMYSLGTLPGYNNSQAYGINAAGQVVGCCYNVGGGWTAFSCCGGDMCDLGTLPGYTFSKAYGINAGGEIVGRFSCYSPFSYEIGGAFAITNGVMRDLDTVAPQPARNRAGDFSVAYAVNDAGQVVGDGYATNGHQSAVLYTGGRPSYICDLGTAYAINNSGQVVGEGYPFSSFGTSHAWLYSGGGLTDLGTLLGSGNISAATGINEEGEAVGWYGMNGPGTLGNRAFLYSGGQVRELPRPAGGLMAEAYGINVSGQAVGAACSSLGVTHACVWLRPVPVVPVQPDFTWAMADRTVTNASGSIVEHNTHDYVCPSAFQVNLDATVSRIDRALPTMYAMTIQGKLDGKMYSAASAETGHFTARLPQGEYIVTLAVADREHAGMLKKTIAVRDILVAAMGDSSSSGEGNPEVPVAGSTPASWMRSDGDAERNRQDAVAHRSSFAASAQMALALERRDPHTSVTFVFVSASGATIRKGGISPYAGIANETGYDANRPMAPQIDQIAQLTQGRTVDVMTVAFGANDIGFSRIVTALILADPERLGGVGRDPATFFDVRDTLWAAVQSGVGTNWDNVTARLGNPALGGVDSSTIAGLNGLPGDYALLAARMAALKPKNVFLMGYPDFTTQRDAGGRVIVSPEIVQDIAPGGWGNLWYKLEVDMQESTWIRRPVVAALTATLRTVASKNHWTFVDPYAAFAGHGYSAEGTNRWIVTATESKTQQGPNSLSQTMGTLHPNRTGHQVISRLLQDAVFKKVR